MLATAVVYVPVAMVQYAGATLRPASFALINGSGNSRLNLAVALLDGIICRIGLALLLVPTALCLALAAAVIAVGATALLAAFTSGLTPFANILLVIGAGLIVLALGLLFLWLFVWFIFGCMGGLIRGIVNLGRSWCYREVLE